MRRAIASVIFGFLFGKFWLAACLAAGSPAVSAPSAGSADAAAAAQQIERQFNVASGKRLEIDLKTGGALDISGWDSEQVTVSATLGGRDGKDAEVTFDETPAGVEIHSRYTGDRRNRSSDLRFEIKVPRRFDISLNTMGGDVRIAGVEGRIGGQTMGGELDLSNLAGSLNLKTMGGRITLKGSQVDGSVSTMGGEVLIEDVTGDVKGHTMGGNVTYRNVKNSAGGGAATDKEVRISSMGGQINVDDAPAGAHVTTMGGDIRIRTAGAPVYAKTMGGRIQIGEVNGGVRAKTMGGDIEVRMVGNPEDGRRDVELTSMGGDITLTVPEGLSMDIAIELAQTKNARETYSITSDFPLAQRESADWIYDQGTPRKIIYGTGNIAGGRNKIVIKTINGNVHLRRG